MAAKKHRRIKLFIDKNKWKERYKEYKKTILLFITNKCNLSCSYCFNLPNLSGNPEMSLDYIKKIVEANPKINKYDLQGGEPLLHTQINEIIDYLSSKNKKIGLYTNGYLMQNLKTGHKSVKLCISFQSLKSKNKSCKPLINITKNIKFYQDHYPFKLIFLMNNQNKHLLKSVVSYVEKEFESIPTLTIGLVRDEADYWNDDKEYILPFKEYATLVQNLLNNYKGRLNFDIFTKGVLYTDKLPSKKENQICRFKNIFMEGYVPCLYLIAHDKKIPVGDNLKIPYPKHNKCSRTGRKNCLADKIYLINKNGD